MSEFKRGAVMNIIKLSDYRERPIHPDLAAAYDAYEWLSNQLGGPNNKHVEAAMAAMDRDAAAIRLAIEQSKSPF